MSLRQSITIAADVDRVWSLVADPVSHAKWNPRIVSVNRRQKGAARFGERFARVYQMSGRQRQCQVEVTAFEPPHRIVFLQHSTFKKKEQIVEESYDVSPCSTGVRVVQKINLSRSGIPWLLRVFIWLLSRFGWSQEQPYLQRLKMLAEQSAGSAKEAAK